MHYIKAENPSAAWFKAVKLIWNDGRTGDGWRWKEILYLLVEIEKPTERNDRMIHDVFKKEMGERWAEKWGKFDLGNAEKQQWYKTYEGRLIKYENGQLDQIKFIVDRLEKSTKSNHLFISTFDPTLDIKQGSYKKDGTLNIGLHVIEKQGYMPCLTALNFSYREEMGVNLFALFRSHDFGRKAYGNYQWLGSLLQEVCNRSGLKMGHVLCFSCSAFIRRDERKEVEAILKELEGLQMADKCPKCGSKNITSLGDTGEIERFEVFICEDCKHYWYETEGPNPKAQS